MAPDAAGRFESLLLALAAEPDPQTTVSDPAEAANAHVADSLSVLELPKLRTATRIVDLGAGAGFPGLPLAIALPDATVDLIESTRRKCALIDRLAAAGGAANARPLHARAEEWGTTDPPEGGREAYDAATARALGPLPLIVEYAAPLLREGGVLVAWKGARDHSEEREGREAAAGLGMEPAIVKRVRPFPGAKHRHLHVYRKAGPTPERFPRRAGMAAKRPLGRGRR